MRNDILAERLRRGLVVKLARPANVQARVTAVLEWPEGLEVVVRYLNGPSEGTLASAFVKPMDRVALA